MRRILIVVDMQNDFITGVLPAEGGVDIVPRVVDKINGDWDLIIFTKDDHHPESYRRSIEGMRLPMHCEYASDGFQFVDKIRQCVPPVWVESNIMVVYKDTFGSYEDIPNEIADLCSMEWQCHQDDLEIEICGVCTDICVISNALILRSVFPNAEIIVDASCCAGTTKEAHRAALSIMRGCMIDVVNDAE